MKPLKPIFWGLLLVMLDLRFEQLEGLPERVDVLPDLLGWVVCGVGLLRVVQLSRWFTVALFGSGVGVIAGAGDLLSPPPGALVGTLDLVATLLLTFGTCSGIVAAAASPRDRSSANLLRWIDLVLTGPFVVGAVVVVVRDLAEVGNARMHHVDAGPELLLLVPVVVVLVVWFLALVRRVTFPAGRGAAVHT